MKRRILSMLLSACFIVSLLPSLTFAAMTFTDMPSDYSTAALEAATANGLLTGSGGNILPNDNLTRAQMAAIITRAFGATEQASLAAYTDVPASAWYFSDMGKAVQMKVFSGNNGLLSPDAAITRQEAFTVLARAFKLKYGTATDLSSFSDATNVANWAVGSTAAMVTDGYVQGANGRINPKANISRKVPVMEPLEAD